MKVAIDGPAGSGKSTVCKMLASKYNLVYLDTGAMYRAVAWLELRYPKIKISNVIGNVKFIFFNNGKKLSINYEGQTLELTDQIRTMEVSEKVSSTASNTSVREALVKKQQEYAQNNNVIMEGRDITTVVLPDAEVKVFMTASATARAERRFLELKEKNIDTSYTNVLENIIKRDKNDSSRDNSPMKIATDAVLIDTTDLTLEDVCEKIGKLIENTKN